MSNRLKKLIDLVLASVLPKQEDTETAEVVAELMESAETLPDVEWLASESGMGKIPEDLLAESGFWEKTSKRPKRQKRHKPPVTGVVAKGKHTGRRTSRRSQRVSDDSHPSIRKAS